MKKILLALILCPLSSINAMQQFTARNSTKNPIIFHGKILEPNEQQNFELPCSTPITIKSSEQQEPLLTFLDAGTTLIEITYTNNPAPDSSELMVRKKTTHRFIILKGNT